MQADYEGLYEEEMDFREAGGYPPCAHMTAVHVSCGDQDRLELAMGYLRQFAQRVSTPYGIRVLGPADEPVAKLQDTYRKVMYLKHRDSRVLQTARDRIRQYIAINDGFKGLLFQYEED